MYLKYCGSALMITLDRPPHQIMTWVGLERYGYLEEAQRLAYRFLYMMTTAFVDFNGVVPEKVRLMSQDNRLHLLRFWTSLMPSSSPTLLMLSMAIKGSTSRWFHARVLVG